MYIRVFLQQANTLITRKNICFSAYSESRPNAFFLISWEFEKITLILQGFSIHTNISQVEHFFKAVKFT